LVQVTLRNITVRLPGFIFHGFHVTFSDIAVQIKFIDISDLLVGFVYHFKTCRSGHRFHVIFRDIAVQFTFRDIADLVAGFVYRIETCRSVNLLLFKLFIQGFKLSYSIVTLKNIQY
jgi:hypothetical protein